MSIQRAIGFDVIALLLFAFFARLAHRTEDMPLTVETWLGTALPFILGALLAWGAFWMANRRSAYAEHLPSPNSISPVGLSVWVSAVVFGLVIWGIRHSSFPHWSFIIVASSMSALLILGWRKLLGAKS